MQGSIYPRAHRRETPAVKAPFERELRVELDAEPLDEPEHVARVAAFLLGLVASQAHAKGVAS